MPSFIIISRNLGLKQWGVGANHAIDNGLLYAVLVLYCALTGLTSRGLINASYRKSGYQEAQPDISFYVGSTVQSIPQSNELIDLDRIPAPNLAIEIAVTSLNDYLGKKRLLYEDLGIQEYWVVDVEDSVILAFHIKDGGSFRIQTSQVFPNLELRILEQALRDRKT